MRREGDNGRICCGDFEVILLLIAALVRISSKVEIGWLGLDDAMMHERGRPSRGSVR